MKKTRMAMLAVALVAGMSPMALAQGGGPPGGGRGPRIVQPADYRTLFLTVQVSQELQKKIDSVGKAYTDSINLVLPPGRGGGPGGGGNTPPDSVMEKAVALATARNKVFDTMLDKNQRKAFDAAVAAAAAAAGRAAGGGDDE